MNHQQFNSNPTMPAPLPDSRAHLKRSSPWASSSDELRKLGKTTRRGSLTNNHNNSMASLASTGRLPSFLSVEKSSSNYLNRLNGSASSNSSSGSSYHNFNGNSSTQNASFHLSTSNASFNRSGSRPRFAQHSSGSLSVNSASNAPLGNGGITTNAVMQMAQRSNGSSVKTVIADLNRLCAEAQQNVDVTTRIPPLNECTMLSLWAVDAYYKVLISKYGGIEAVVTAMMTFPASADLQACCCKILKNIGNKQSVRNAGGVAALATAMQHHSQSIQVQSEACEALKSQVPMLPSESRDVLQGLLPLLHHAKEMYLTQAGKSSAVFLLDFIPATLSR